MPLDVLMIIGHSLESEEYNKIAYMFNQMQVVAESKFSSVLRFMQEKQYKLFVFLSYEESLPPDWKIDEIRLEIPVIIFLKVNLLDLYLFQSFLDSIGLLSKPAAEQSTDTAIHPFLYKSLLFIEENIQENDLSLEKVAASVFVSRCHYSRLFKEHFGTGFKEYIMNKRIQKARAMLRDGQSVTDVCYAVGYGDLTHFGRVFKRLVGVNPSVYRRSKGKAYLKEIG